MGNLTYVFERVERKFLLTPAQYMGLMRTLPEYMQADQYGESTILSLYLDTEDSLIDIRIEARLQGKAAPSQLRRAGRDGQRLSGSEEKVRGVVYKRRICLPLARAMECLAQGSVPAAGGQIGREIAYMLRRYRLQPAVLLAYDRTAYAELEPSPNQLRITIDRDIRSRQTDLDLRLGAAGELLAPGMRLMEIKTAHAIPLWLCAALDQNEIRPTSFSKYGRVYEARMRAAQARAVRPAIVKGGLPDAVCHV